MRILLILGSVICAVLFSLFIRNEEKLTAERQQHVNELAKELQPVNGERKKWQDDDKAWKATL